MTVPEKPPGLDRQLWFDTSRMRPDEWARTSVERFNTAVQYQMAYEEGKKMVEDEQQASQAAKDRLKKRAGMGQVG